MAICHWHPLKLGILWLVDIAVFVALWLEAPRRHDRTLAIIVWLILSLPVFSITWRWATGRKRRGETNLVYIEAKEANSLRWIGAFALGTIAVLGYLAGFAVLVYVIVFPSIHLTSVIEDLLKGWISDDYLFGASIILMGIGMIGIIAVWELIEDLVESRRYRKRAVSQGCP
jgi:hypothetical protein